MKDWMPDASERFESYKGRVRSAVAGNPTVNPDDVLQDIQAHVDAELGASAEPVTLPALELVLERLGTPTQWVESAAEPVKKRVGEHLRHLTAVWQGRLAGDWGAPVLLAVLTAVSLPLLDSIGVPLLAFAYFTGRSILMHGEPTLNGYRRLLVMAPVALASALLAGLAVSVPLLVVGPYFSARDLAPLGVWWLLLGYAASREPKRIRAALYPLADWFEPTHGRLLMLLGAGLIALAVSGAI